jgi:hypothetical protein
MKIGSTFTAHRSNWMTMARSATLATRAGTGIAARFRVAIAAIVIMAIALDVAVTAAVPAMPATPPMLDRFDALDGVDIDVPAMAVVAPIDIDAVRGMIVTFDARPAAAAVIIIAASAERAARRPAIVVGESGSSRNGERSESRSDAERFQSEHV